MENDEWCPARAVRARYGNVSAMTIWRWLQNPAIDFPKPILISGRRYWSVLQLNTFDERRRASIESQRRPESREPPGREREEPKPW